MNDFDKGYEGKGGNLGAAFEHAWDRAKEDGAPPGRYRVEIFVETENPIRGYAVIITPDGG